MNSAMVRTLLVRGMLAGLAAGLLAFGLAYVIGEPAVDAGIAYQDAHAHAHEHEAEIVSRAVQSTAGLATAVLVFGTAVGGIAALAFCFALGRIGRLGARATAALVAGGAFVTVYLVPFLKYPANPPGANDPDTIGKRTTLYFGMIALTVLVGIAVVILGRRLADRYGNWNATVAAAAAFVAVMSVAMAALPAVNEVPKDFPAGVLWEFRMASLGIHALLWASFGVVFGFLADRALRAPAAEEPGTTASGVPTPL
ncbi:CbtA family protein [Streptomyces thermospinosisporus]|uniref:CbtA family protein n=1 Tax=Streptomyces thermospinosisporus TaxID=161482 RepID=A0ABN1YYB2_9ACTN